MSLACDYDLHGILGMEKRKKKNKENNPDIYLYAVPH